MADPPYNIGKDFGVVKDRLPLGRYLEWTQAWLGECRRLLAADGVIYVYGYPEILARVAARYPVEEQRWLVWHYTNKAAPASSFWQRSHESILCLWRAGAPRPALEVEQIREPYTSGYRSSLGQRRAATAGRFGGARGAATRYRDHGGALPRDVIKIPALAGGAGAKERWFICHDCGGRALPPAALAAHRGHRILKHPTQKPLALARRLLRSRIRGAGGRVLVPFAGSGSECVAAQQLGIGYLGVEVNRDYLKLARKWLAHAAAGGL
ncbi:MAG: site-specific DNA-methyltransferase [Betaproteobacteria bacterium AqS2]|uniref:Methyltransferase n=1 Tax=Candidatus Amphirhobacter heronislandensis TaxID=1732024 RepID=A0A930Y1R0_9GAMM|nr:site-specific DNA-methyltransferase [Betaproteobacteria bacterium AqS2]